MMRPGVVPEMSGPRENLLPFPRAEAGLEVRRQAGDRTIPWKKISELLEALEVEQTPEGLLWRTLERLEILVPYHYSLAALWSSEFPARPPLIKIRAARPALIDRYSKREPMIDLWRRSTLMSDIAGGGGRSDIGISNLNGSGSGAFAISLHKADSSVFSERDSRILAALHPHLHNLFTAAVDPMDARDRLMKEAAQRAGLSKREQDICMHLCDRFTIAETAERLHISTHTVAKHLEHIYQKLGVSRREAARTHVCGDEPGAGLGDRLSWQESV
jgi:DNA-binding CsgD family transcriptional regulator